MKAVEFHCPHIGRKKAGKIGGKPSFLARGAQAAADAPRRVGIMEVPDVDSLLCRTNGAELPIHDSLEAEHKQQSQ